MIMSIIFIIMLIKIIMKQGETLMMIMMIIFMKNHETNFSVSGQEEDKDEAGGDTYDDYDDHYFDHEHQYNANFLENHDKTFQCLDKKRIKMKQGETLMMIMMIIILIMSINIMQISLKIMIKLFSVWTRKG